jgi:lipoprotein-anchoring transpeptidase ErfK/SrfK
MRFLPCLFQSRILVGYAWFATLLALGTVLNAEESPSTSTKPASQEVPKNKPPISYPNILESASPEKIYVFISLGQQRVYFKVGEEIAIDSPVSTGKKAGMTPVGSYVIVEKNAKHYSNLYGKFVSESGSVVRSNVSTRTDTPPEGAKFVGAPMKWFMRLGKHKEDYMSLGMHAGVLPGYPASHGCIRLPEEIAKIIYQIAPVGTSVCITE